MKSSQFPIFFSNNTLKDIDTISRSLVEIVSSSYSNNEQRRLNYNFLLFYISLAKIIDPENDRAIIIKAELFDQVGQHQVAVDIYNKLFEFNTPFTKDDDYIFQPTYRNRTSAMRNMQRQFNHILEKCNLKKNF